MKNRGFVHTALVLLLLSTAPAAASTQQAQEGDVEVCGGSLFYRSAGSGPVIVFLHGYSNSSTVWEPYLAELGQENRVIAFDLPGHGRSDSLSSTFSHRGSAVSLSEALDALDIPAFHLVGHSSGALVALHVALQHPERVLSVVSISAPWRIPDEMRQMASGISLETAPPPMLEALRAWHPGGTPQIRWILDQQRRMASDSTEMALADEQLQRVTAPTLVVHGDRDELLPVGDALELAGRLPRASLLILPGGNHGFIMEAGLASALLTSALAEFLEDPDT